MQYRMVEPIGRLISHCFYEGKLNSAQGDRRVALCLNRRGSELVHESCRIEARKPQGRVSLTRRRRSLICRVLQQLNATLRESGSNQPRSVLVLSAYKSQVTHLHRRVVPVTHELSHLKVIAVPSIEFRVSKPM